MIDKLEKSRNNKNIITLLVVSVKGMKRNVMLEISKSCECEKYYQAEKVI